jgi:hypothetical protein
MVQRIAQLELAQTGTGQTAPGAAGIRAFILGLAIRRFACAAFGAE